MLVIDRKKYESIRIGDNIIVTVVRVKGEHVKLGIECPREKKILRTELVERESEEDAA